jgi:uncharacterized membrane protein
MKHGMFLLIIKQVVIIFLNLLGTMGMLLIIYGVVCQMTDTTWAPLETIAEWLSSSVTCLATVIVACTAYQKPNQRKADFHSRVIVAPIVILCVIGAIVYMYMSGRPLHRFIVNGFAIASLAGAILRSLPVSGLDIMKEIPD